MMVEQTQGTGTAQALSHALEALTFLAGSLAGDAPAAQIVHAAREGLRQRLEAVRWNRYAAHVNARSRRLAFRRRHTGARP